MAKDLFYRRGVRAVGVDQIVHEAGVTKPSLYRAYKSKDELVTACLQESLEQGRAEVMAALEAGGPLPREQLSALFLHFEGKISCPDYRGCPVSNMAVEMPELGHPGRQIAEQCKTELRALIGELARALDVGEPEELADGIMLVIEGAMSSHHLFGSQGPASSLAATCERLVSSHMKIAAAR